MINKGKIKATKNECLIETRFLLMNETVANTLGRLLFVYGAGFVVFSSGHKFIPTYSDIGFCYIRLSLLNTCDKTGSMACNDFKF